MTPTTQERKQREGAKIIEKRRRTSLHEAGHAAVAHALGFDVREVEVRKDGTGVCWAHIPPCDSLDDIRNEIRFDLAGKLAVALEAHESVRDDALSSIVESEADLDMPGRSGMAGYRSAVTRLLGSELEAYRWLDREIPVVAEDTKRILVDKWDEVVDLAKRLVRDGTVRYERKSKPRRSLQLASKNALGRKRRPHPTEIAACLRFLSRSAVESDNNKVRAWLREGGYEITAAGKEHR